MKFSSYGLWALATVLVADAHNLPSPEHTCVIPASKDGSDDSPAIRKAFDKCGKNGKVVFQKDTTYSIQTALQLHNLKNVEVDMFGTLENSWANVGDDCVSFKPGSTNMHVKNLTCYNSAGIAIGSLGQYEGVRDVVENITAEDISLYGSRNGAYIKTYVGKRTYWPPQGGGGGNGYVRNVVFKNFHIENITASPVLIQQCTHWAGYNVPACVDTPPTGFFSNISWSNFTGYMNEKVGTKAISWTCSPLATCEGFSFKDINVKSANGTDGTHSCTNVVGYDSNCHIKS
ncbi:hypothetical protein TgHK011_010174 [Trichoderma gracile]|nr:hypothetical protein TgHK011_010174 [Trichoderma gracile]